MPEPNASLEVRRAQPADGDAIVHMARALAAAVDDPPPDLTPEALAGQLFGVEPWAECLLAVRGDRPVGYVLVCRGFEAHTGQRRLWIADLYVEPDARALGAGRRLMAAVAGRALELGCAAVWWDLWTENKVGRGFYRRLEAEVVDDLAQLRLTGEALGRLAADLED